MGTKDQMESPPPLILPKTNRLPITYNKAGKVREVQLTLRACNASKIANELLLESSQPTDSSRRYGIAQEHNFINSKAAFLQVTNVISFFSRYVLGSTFLQLCKLLSLEEHPIVQKPVDPSLFIHRFANRLVGDNYMGITKTALRVIASMNRDWMQVRIVHVCEATLTKRLIEFENTKSGSLTIEEFNKRAEELERECGTAKQPNNGFKACGMNELLCEHKGSGKAPFAHGLCKSCYDDFIKLSGGLDGGSDPPAFQQAERKRMTKECVVDDSSGSSFVIVPCQGLKNSDQSLCFRKCSNQVVFQSFSNEVKACIMHFKAPIHIKKSVYSYATDGADQDEDVLKPIKLKLLMRSDGGAATNHVAVSDDIDEILPGVDGTNNNVPDLSESLSDIDDIEVDGYLHNEEEKHYKKIIWEEMNREYIQEQEAKEAAAAAAKKAYEAKFRNCPEEMQAAQDLAAAAAAAVAKSRKERQQKRAAEARNSTPAQTAAEATRQMLTKKVHNVVYN
ncbi:cyclin/Brf1-like TBP-binding protein [Actinidia rufa]|uniref:Cyclin/Brf1-like TBP-binding protein n=1 Tax=Actinidia rufa TaxID=165716 RepID=A0A7J0F491_9ERIC|nr:cyclin/Brf1-like TBP-binding protein [Actinidia rufa]